MKKKLVSLVMAALMLFAANIPAFAAKADKNAADSAVHVMYVNTNDAKVCLNFTGDRAECAGFIDAKSGTTKITATGILKRVNSDGTTTTVKTWSGLSAAGEELDIDKAYYVDSGYTYEFEIDAQIYRNGTVEYISISDSDYCEG
jgi:hypothetical protein